MENKHTGILATETASVAFAAFLSLLRHTGTELPVPDSVLAEAMMKGLDFISAYTLVEDDGDDEVAYEEAVESMNTAIDNLQSDLDVIAEALRDEGN